MKNIVLGVAATVALLALACGSGTEADVGVADQEWSTTSTLAARQHRPVEVVVDATHVYWSVYDPSGDRAPFERRHDILRVAKTGGAIEEVATGQRDLVGLALDEGYVYWLARAGACSASAPTGVARRIAKSGGAVEELAAGLPCGAPSANTQAVVDGSHLYFSGDDGVRRIAKGGGAPEMFAIAGKNPHASVDSTVLLRQDEGTIYWGDSYGPLWAQPKTGAAATKLLDESPWEAAVDGDALYFERDGQLLRVAKTGGAPVALAQAGRGAHALAVDDAHVYWSDVVDDTIWRVEKTGGAPLERFATGERAYALAIDEGAVYFPSWGRELGGMVPDYVDQSGAIRRRTKR